MKRSEDHVFQTQQIPVYEAQSALTGSQNSQIFALNIPARKLF